MKTNFHPFLIAIMLLNCNVLFSSNCKEGKQFFKSRILSREEMVITGSFQFELEIIAIENCLLDSISIIDQSSFLNVKFNSTNNVSPIKIKAYNQLVFTKGDTLKCSIYVTHSVNNLPFYPENIGFNICTHNISETFKNYNIGKIYFTPYNSVEVWDIKDFKSLPRVWATKVSPEPTRVSIPRTAIPVSTKPTNLEIQYDWQKYYQLTRVEGLPYLIQMAALHPDTIKYYKTKDSIEVMQGKHEGQLHKKSIFDNIFNGTIQGILVATYVNDLGDALN